jgi:electron transfer flavoprotein beta subunit
MNIVVTIKQVPDTNEIRIDPVTNTLMRDGVPAIITPDDVAAIEEALVLKDKYNATVTVISMGPPQAEKALREALSMGVDRAILLTDRAFAGSDTLATSTILAAAIDKIGFDCIIAGRQAIDGDTAQVGPQIAEHLGIPQITYAEKIAYDAASKVFNVRRQYEKYYQDIEVSGKVLLTILSGYNSPRYMHVAKIIAQSQTDIEKWGLSDIDVNVETIGLKGSPTRVKSTFTKQAAGGGEKFELDTKESAKLIVEKLSEQHFI